MARTTKTGMYMLATAARDAQALVAAAGGPSRHSPPAQAVERLMSAYQRMDRKVQKRVQWPSSFRVHEQEEAAAFALLVKYKYVMPRQAQDTTALGLSKRAGRRID